MTTPTHWQTLAEELSGLSERAFHAGWMDGLEYRIWQIVQGGDRRYGQIRLTDDEVAMLRDLSEQLGGWIRFNDDSGSEEFVDKARWLRIYEEWLRNQPVR